MKGKGRRTGTLLPAAILSSTGRSSGSAPARTAVRLPEQGLEAWRSPACAQWAAPGVTVYAVPTSAGVATVACAAPAGQGASLAGQCDAIAASLRLKRATAYPIGPSSAYASTLKSTTLGQLQEVVTANETSLTQSG